MASRPACKRKGTNRNTPATRLYNADLKIHLVSRMDEVLKHALLAHLGFLAVVLGARLEIDEEGHRFSLFDPQFEIPNL